MGIFENKHSNWITLILTTKCNLGCNYCYEKEFKSSVMTFENAIDIVNWFYKNSNSKEKGISFFGGEPMLEFSSIEGIVKYCVEKNMDIEFSITTNGTILCEKTINLLRKFKFVNVSIDGIKIAHDSFRKIKNSNKGSFDLIDFELLRTLDNINVNSVITNENIYYFGQSLDFIAKNISKNYSFKVAYETNWKYNDILEYKRQWMNLAEKFIKDIENQKSLLLYKSIFSLLGVNKSYYLNKAYCDALKGNLAILPNGEVFPCHRLVHLKEYSLGNVFKKVNFEKKCELSSQEIKKECENCLGKSICPKRCYALEHYFSKSKVSFNNSDFVFCKLVKINMEILTFLYKKLENNKMFSAVYASSMPKETILK